MCVPLYSLTYQKISTQSWIKHLPLVGALPQVLSMAHQWLCQHRHVIIGNTMSTYLLCFRCSDLIICNSVNVTTVTIISTHMKCMQHLYPYSNHDYVVESILSMPMSSILLSLSQIYCQCHFHQCQPIFPYCQQSPPLALMEILFSFLPLWH
jgi:hypothetical protein